MIDIRGGTISSTGNYGAGGPGASGKDNYEPSVWLVDNTVFKMSAGTIKNSTGYAVATYDSSSITATITGGSISSKNF